MIPAIQAPEGAGVKDWDLHHGPKPVGAPALRQFGGIRAAGASGLIEKFTATPEEVRGVWKCFRETKNLMFQSPAAPQYAIGGMPLPRLHTALHDKTQRYITVDI